MASPIAHSFAGLWSLLFALARYRSQIGESWRRYLAPFLVFVLLANLPDFDFLIELGSHAGEVHRGLSHSLLAAVVVSLGVGSVWRVVPRFWDSVLLYFIAYGSHLLMDLFTGRSLGWTQSGSGIPLFWPWRQEFSSQFVLFYGVEHANVAALFSIDNLLSCVYELLICGTLTVVLLFLWKPKLKSRRTNPSLSKVMPELQRP